MPLSKRAIAELVGTFWLVFGGCGSAVFAGHVIGWHGVALAFGLTVLTMAYAIGHVSGCHLNPAVSIGLVVGGRFPAKELPHYIGAQVAGGIIAIALIYVITGGGAGEYGFAANGWGPEFAAANGKSYKAYSVAAAFSAEFVLTFIFLMIILGATDKRAPAGFAGIAIGLGLTLIHLIGIPITNLSVNPARSTAPALFALGGAIKQVWLFWVAPIAGAALAGFVYPLITGEKKVVSGKSGRK